MHWPLNGIRIVDLTQNVAGPYAAMILAELGASVTKVEPPLGDATRFWGPPFWEGQSATYLALNRNKEQVSIDIKTPAGQMELEALLSKADVLMVSSRPEALQRVQLDTASVRRRFSRIIYSEVTAFGHYGPRQFDPGYDPLMQALGGIMSVTGRPGEEPVRVGTSIVDMGTGMWVALGVMAALRLRDHTGDGQVVTGSLFETSVGWMTYHITSYLASGLPPHGWGSGTAMIAPYEAFPAQDGWVVIAAGNDALFGKLCAALNHSEWAQDSRYLTNARRVENRHILHNAIAELTTRQPMEHWQQRLKELGIPVAPVTDVAGLVCDPQLLASGILQTYPSATIPEFRSVGLPLLLNGLRPPLRTPPPGV